MGKIFYLMGKSATGKDTLYQMILKACPDLKTVILYTTRPMRDMEREGVEYHFVNQEQLDQFHKLGKVIEIRTYQTILGPWSYATVDDGQINLKTENYLIIGTLESYEKLRTYFGDSGMVPLYIHVDDGIRLRRALKREELQEKPNYKEICRRFLADDDDFSESNLIKCRITRRFENHGLEGCLLELLEEINRHR